ncbi:MAG TPA: DoxX family protein [Thermoanaerobaculia bacterium]|nr:DoxX family protein [Thermoanaerobaculia bacterium]
MTKFLGRYSEQIYALLRIVAGWCFLLHGSQKLFGWPGDRPPIESVASLMGLAGIIELVGGILILVGLFASIAAFIASGQMAVAYWMAHGSEGSPFFPLMNGGEPAVLFCFLFLYVAAKGAGTWSVAAALNKPALQ